MNKPVPDQAARDAAIDPHHSVLLRAPAGSGKTGVLLLRFLNCLLSAPTPEAVVAITFTRKAAAEVRERILDALTIQEGDGSPYGDTLAALASQVRERDQQQGWGLLHNPSRLRISTFDSFCARIARRLPLLSGLGQIQTTDDADALYREAIFNLFRQLEGDDAALRAALGNVLDYASNRLEQLIPLLSNLLAKRDQWVEGVVAGDVAGMEQALQAVVVSAYQDCCEHLARHDFSQLIEIVRQQSGHEEKLAWACDCAELQPFDEGNLRLHARLANLMLTGTGNSRSLRKRVDKNLGFPPKQAATEALKAWLSQRHEDPALEEFTATLRALADLPLPTLPEAARSLIEDLMRVLKHLLAELHLVFDSRGQLDFPEVAFRAINALTPLPDSEGVYGDALLQEDRIQHVLVDEMQDTSVNQIVLLQHLMQGWEPGDGRSLFLCGDLQQSIYLFRGALVGEFEQLLALGSFNGHPLVSLQLVSNFRSAPALVEWVNTAFTDTFADSYTPAQPQRSEPGEVVVHAFAGDKAAAREQEAARVVALVQAAQRDNPEGSIAILVRSRSHLRAIVPALKQAGLSFAGQDIDRLASQSAVMDYLALLRAWWHGADRASWIALLRAPFVGLNWDDCWVVANAAKEQLISELVLEFDQGSTPAIFQGELVLSGEGVARLQAFAAVWRCIADHPRAVDIRWAVPALWHSLGGPGLVDGQSRRHIERLTNLLADHSPGGILQNWQEFQRALDKLYAESAPAKLEIMTIHKSKGLEFDTVILPGLGEQGRNGEGALFYWRRMAGQLVLAPRSPRGNDEDTDRLYRYLQQFQQSEVNRELDRLLYVALTRARRSLHLVGAAGVSSKGDLTVSSSSLLARLWPQVTADFEAAEVLEPVAAEAVLRTPLAPRRAGELALTVKREWPDENTVETTVDRLARQAREGVLEANIEERCVGLVYHELMRRLAMTGAPREDLYPAIAARLRHYCHPEAALQTSIEQVISLVENTFSCEHGRWILGSYQASGAEQALRRQMGDRLQKFIVDRFFVDGDTCWIIDYKTARGTGEAFLAAQRDRYSEKMQTYKMVISQATGWQEVRAALYFPASQSLVEC